MNAAQIEAEIRSTFEVVETPPMEGLKVSQEVTDFHNNPAGLRAPHILEALASATATESYAVDNDSSVSLALSRVDVGKPYLMLLMVTEVPAMGRAVATL